MNKALRPFALVSFALVTITVAYASDLTKAYEMPDASETINKDSIAGATKYTIPKSCKLDDLETIERGEYLFHNLNSKAAKEKAPKGLATPKKGEIKAYGNCVACHNIENAMGGGTVGPDLSNYKKLFIDTKARDAQFVYQKIADPRVDNKDTAMTINLATKMMNEQEICDLTAYVVQSKTEKK
jgi:sulfur-oxidizing protein SoxX